MMYGQARASSSAPNNDTDSSVVPGSTQPESSPEKRQGEFSDVDEGDLEKSINLALSSALCGTLK